MPSAVVLLSFTLMAVTATLYTGGLGGWMLFASWACGLTIAAKLGPAVWGVPTRSARSTTAYPVVAVGLYGLGLCTATGLSTVPGISSELLMSMGLLPAGYVLSRAMMRAGWAWQSVWQVLQAVCAALAVLAIAERLLTDSRAYAVLADPNLLAGGFNAALLIIFSSLAAELRHGYTPAAARQFGLLLLFAVALGCTGSLSGILCLLTALPALVFLAIRKQSRSAALQLISMASLALLIAVLSSRGLAETPTEKLGGIAKHSSFTVRVEMAQASLAIYRDHPWYGTGLGTYKLFYPQYRGRLDTGTSGDLAHNDYVQFLQEGGPLLLGALLLLVLTTLHAALRPVIAVWRKGLTSSQLLPLGAGAAALALMLQAGMNFVFYSSFTALLIGVLLAGLSARDEPNSNSESARKSPLVFGTVLLALTLVLSATSGARALFLSLTNNSCNLHVCRDLRSNLDFMKGLTAYLTGTQPSWLPARYYLLNNQLQAERSAQDGEQQKQWRLRALEEILSMIEVVPQDAEAFKVLAGILAREPALAIHLPPGLPADQISLQRIIVALSPQNLSARLALAKTLVDADRLADAYTVLFVDGMKYWGMYTWGDAGRMRMLTTIIPIAVSLHHCKDAAEMAAGLGVFIKLQKEAAADIRLVQASYALPASVIEESEKAVLLAASCN